MARHKFWLKWVLALCIAFVLNDLEAAGISVPAGSGQSRPAKSGRGHWQTYDVTDGLAHSQVLSIFQDRDGHLWFATSGGGVSRYDGHSFVTYTAADGLASGHVESILQDKQGVFWFSTWRGISRYDPALGSGQGAWRTFTIADGLAEDWVWTSFEDRDGNLWFCTNGGLMKYDGKTWATYTKRDGLIRNDIRSILQDHKGHIWAANYNAGVCRYDGERFETITKPNDFLSKVLLEDRDGDLWFRTQKGVTRWDGSVWTDFTPADGLVSGAVNAMLQDHGGRLWFATNDGVSRYDPRVRPNGEWKTFHTQDGLSQRQVNTIFQDREGHLWFGTNEDVSRFDDEVFQVFSASEGLSDGVISIYQDRADLYWFGTHEGVVRYDGQVFTQFSTADGLAHNSVRSIVQDQHGRMWFATNEKGVSRYDGKTFTTFSTADGLPDNRIHSVFEDREGHMWFSTDKGVGRYDGETFRVWTQDDGLANNVVWPIFQDQAGDLWFGARWGVSRFDPVKNTFTNFAKKTHEGMVGGMIEAVLQDQVGNYWFGSWGGGVSRYDGQAFTKFMTREGLVSLRIQTGYIDQSGHLWFGSGTSGASRYDGHYFQSLTAQDGLASGWVSSIFQDKDGAYWFGGKDGVTRFQPTLVPPPILLDAMVADQRYEGYNHIEIPNTVGLVTFEFHAISFKTRPGVMLYRYRLKGYDEWQTTHDRTVVYEDLPTGDYIFEVQAIDRDLVYSEKPATMALSVHLPYERIGLWSALAVALVLVVGQTARVIRRDKRLKETQAQLIEEMERELQAAHDMQMGLMPTESPKLEGVEMSGTCIPAREVGGDYYTFIENFGESKVGFVVADVSGKGMQAATIVMRFNEMLIYEASSDRSVNEILNGLDSSLRKRTPPEMFATCGIGVLDLKAKTLSFDSAACPEVYHYQAEDQNVQSLGISGLPLGMALDIPDKVFGHVDLDLSSGDVLVFTSDGVEEAQTLARDFYGEERLAELVGQCGRDGLSAEVIRDRVVADVISFVGEAPQTDDLTVVVLKVL